MILEKKWALVFILLIFHQIINTITFPVHRVDFFGDVINNGTQIWPTSETKLNKPNNERGPHEDVNLNSKTNQSTPVIDDKVKLLGGTWDLDDDSIDLQWDELKNVIDDTGTQNTSEAKLNESSETGPHKDFNLKSKTKSTPAIDNRVKLWGRIWNMDDDSIDRQWDELENEISAFKNDESDDNGLVTPEKRFGNHKSRPNLFGRRNNDFLDMENVKTDRTKSYKSDEKAPQYDIVIDSEATDQNVAEVPDELTESEDTDSNNLQRSSRDVLRRVIREASGKKDAKKGKKKRRRRRRKRKKGKKGGKKGGKTSKNGGKTSKKEGKTSKKGGKTSKKGGKTAALVGSKVNITSVDVVEENLNGNSTMADDDMIIAGVAGGTVVVFLVIVCICIKRRKANAEKMANEMEEEEKKKKKRRKKRKKDRKRKERDDADED